MAPQSDAWTVEINSEEHVSMQDVLAILLPIQDESNHSVTRLFMKRSVWRSDRLNVVLRADQVEACSGFPPSAVESVSGPTVLSCSRAEPIVRLGLHWRAEPNGVWSPLPRAHIPPTEDAILAPKTN